MGQIYSKPTNRRDSSSSASRLAGYWPEKSIDITPEPEVTRPSLPREITHLSNLFDPQEMKSDWKIRSPSGNLLGPRGYFSHPARPLSMRERQERVKKAVQEGNRSVSGGTVTEKVIEVEVVHEKQHVPVKKRAWDELLCF